MNRLGMTLAVGLLIVAALLVIAAVLPQDWFRPAPEPPQPLKVEALVTPANSGAADAPRGGRIEEDGSLTILSAPGSVGRALPWSGRPSQWGVEPQPHDPLPPEMLAGIRALFRLVPQPPRDELMVTTLERRVAGGRLILDRGCFRLNGTDGAIAVFPPGTKLGLIDGYMVVGPPGFPPELSTRVGEHVFWEGDTFRNFDQASLQRIATYCGPGPAGTVMPASATVQQARNDGLEASEYAERYGVDWDEALRRVRQCRERMEQNAPRGGDMPLVDNLCGSIPPQPVFDPEECPPGTSLSGGLCRTPEGHIRPIPD